MMSKYVSLDEQLDTIQQQDVSALGRSVCPAVLLCLSVSICSSRLTYLLLTLQDMSFDNNYAQDSSKAM